MKELRASDRYGLEEPRRSIIQMEMFDLEDDRLFSSLDDEFMLSVSERTRLKCRTQMAELGLQNYSSSYDNAHYNPEDNAYYNPELDMDQQSQEFWDSL